MLKRKFDLQLFADDEPQDKPQDEPKDNPEGATDDNSEEKPLTKEDIQKMIQSETDRVRTEYSKKVKALEQEKEELEKEKMTEEEKAKFELEKREKELADREKEILKRDLTIRTVDLLKENELPLDFREFVTGKDEDSTNERVDTFKKLWDEEIKKAIDDIYKSNGRKVKKATGDNEITKEQFDKMSYTEKVELYNENIELYEKLKQ